MIFNVVVDASIRHWVAVVDPTEGYEVGLGETSQELVAYFYADDGIIASPWLERLQVLFDVLIYLFDRVFLQMNMQKMVNMVFRACRAPGVWLEAAYERRVTGIGKLYQERLHRRVQFPDFGVDLAASSLLVHRQSQHGVVHGEQGRPPIPPTLGEAQTYQVCFPMVPAIIQCPVEGCPGGATNWTNLRVQFLHLRVQDTIVIL